MAITQKYSTNAALQYNEVLTNYLINDASANKKFLTNAPLNRLIRANELSALYFLIDDASFAGATLLKFKDADGNLIYEDTQTLSSTYNIHNGVVIGFEDVPYYVPANTAKICAVITSNANVFNNPNFEQGSGNLFTSWTLTQPSRTNYCFYSQDFTNWASDNVTVTSNFALAPNGTMTADRIVFDAGVNAYVISNTVTGLIVGNDYIAHVWLKANSPTTIRMVDAFTGVGSTVNITTEWQQFSIILVANGGGQVAFQIDNYTVGLGQVARDIFAWQGQIEEGLFITPTILTTNATVTTSLGEFLQDATGGPDGSRAMKLWADVGGITFASQTRTLATTNYVFKAWAKIIDTGVTNPKIGLVINGVDVGRSAVLTTTYQWIEIPFAATAGTYAEAIFYDNDENYGFAIIDNVSIRRAVDTEITEERCFELDTRCFQTENTIQWVNKLGGVDTWTFTGNPIQTRNTEREGLIEYPMQDNYQSPNEIYAYRSIKSHEVMNLFHRCENEETAIWLRSELQDAIQAYVKVGDDYHPIIPTTSSVQIRNYAQRDPNVRFTFRFAYDINIQRR